MQGYKPIKIKKQYKQEYKWTKKLNKEMFSTQIEFKMLKTYLQSYKI